MLKFNHTGSGCQRLAGSAVEHLKHYYYYYDTCVNAMLYISTFATGIL